MKINLPNQITLGRLALSIVFFVVLAQYSVGESAARLLDVAAAIFIFAALTDIVDGYLARKQNQVTSFGRVIDPFVDKVLVCGAYAFFAGPGFVRDGVNITGVATWMVVLILGRELLVTGLRSHTEARGDAFGANVFGKTKMLLQSFTAGYILITLAHPDGSLGSRGFVIGRGALIWATVIVTTLSMLAYLRAARDVLTDTARPTETA